MKVKEYLQQTIFNLTEENNIDHVFVTQILSTSGICKKTFYKYFIDKYDLFNSALESFIFSKIPEEKSLKAFLDSYVSLCFKYRKSLVNSFNSVDHNSPKKKNINFLAENLGKYYPSNENKKEMMQAYAEMLTNQMIKFLSSDNINCETLTNFLYSLISKPHSNTEL